YGYFATGSAMDFGLAWEGPHFVVPKDQGFLAPPDALAVSAWDDATTLRFERWNPLGSDAEREHFRINRERNWRQIVDICSRRFTPLIWPILIAAVVCACTAADPPPRRPGFILVSALILYPVGYYLLHVYPRFLIPMCVLLLLIGAWVIAAVARAVRLNPVLRILATALLCLSFLYGPGLPPERG